MGLFEKHIYRCEDSVDGIFTAIYDAWSSRYGHNNIKIIINSIDDNYELFSTYIDIETNYEKSYKVCKSIKEKIGDYAYSVVVKAALSTFIDKADCIYRFLILGFSMGKNITEMRQDNYVSKVLKMSQRVGYEVNKLWGFVRFSEININKYIKYDNKELLEKNSENNKILVSIISPDNNVLELLDEHFSDRMSNENWIICDNKRNISLFHRRQMASFIIKLSEDEISLIKDKVSQSDNIYEDNIEKLWKEFFNSIAISERKNYKLQRQMLPIRFRSNMIDFS